MGSVCVLCVLLRRSVVSRVRSGVIPHKMREDRVVNRAGFPDLFLCPVACATQSLLIAGDPQCDDDNICNEKCWSESANELRVVGGGW